MNTLECIKTRHSTRKFKADQLSRKLIDQVLDAGRRAPSGGNTQLTHFMVITNQDMLNELVTLVQEEYGNADYRKYFTLHGEYHQDVRRRQICI